jgi:hypothetical protein
MFRFLLGALLVLCLCSVTEARGRRGGWRGGSGGGSSLHFGVPAGMSNATAQGVANIMATLGRVGHCGGNRGYEGCGMASTQAGAYSICCYANSGMRTVDVGYARSASGMWYCCRRYGN